MKRANVGNVAEMVGFAGEFIAELGASDAPSSATIIALSGELGAGKTTFAQAVAKALGVKETVNSPTFVIEKVYALDSERWGHLVHIDAYRLKNANELRTLGWDEMAGDPSNLILVEWPEHVEGAIPKDAHRISIEIGEGEERTIYYGE